jgi:hypothetical protein
MKDDDTKNKTATLVGVLLGDLNVAKTTTDILILQGKIQSDQRDEEPKIIP